MKTGTKWALGLGSGVVVIGGGIWLLRIRHRSSTVPTTTTPSTPHLTAAQLLWPAPKPFGTVAGAMALGPSINGVGPNGVYQLARLITAPVTGIYKMQVAADDAAQLSLDGQPLAVIALSQGMVTLSVPLTAGPHVLLATVSNNGLATATLVPYQSGSPNPTGLSLQLTDPSGVVILAPGNPSGWHDSGYASNLQVTTTTPLTLTGSV